MPDEVLTLKEVASLLRVTERTVYTLLGDGAIPAFKVGQQWRFQRTALDRWMAQRSIRPASTQRRT